MQNPLTQTQLKCRDLEREQGGKEETRKEEGRLLADGLGETDASRVEVAQKNAQEQVAEESSGSAGKQAVAHRRCGCIASNKIGCNDCASSILREASDQEGERAQGKEKIPLTQAQYAEIIGSLKATKNVKIMRAFMLPLSDNEVQTLYTMVDKTASFQEKPRLLEFLREQVEKREVLEKLKSEQAMENRQLVEKAVLWGGLGLLLFIIYVFFVGPAILSWKSYSTVTSGQAVSSQTLSGKHVFPPESGSGVFQDARIGLATSGIAGGLEGQSGKGAGGQPDSGRAESSGKVESRPATQGLRFAITKFQILYLFGIVCVTLFIIYVSTVIKDFYNRAKESQRRLQKLIERRVI